MATSMSEAEEQMNGLSAEYPHGKTAIPGLVEKKGPLTAEDIKGVENIGGKADETKEIDGVPITPKMAAEVRSAEDKVGHNTGKGSLAARMQSAAVYNVQEHVVPPVGTTTIGTTRDVRFDKEAGEEFKNKIKAGTKNMTAV